VEFTTGTAVVTWPRLSKDLLVFDSFHDFQREHGHALTGVATYWLDPEPITTLPDASLPRLDTTRQQLPASDA